MKLILFDKIQKDFPVRACVRSDAFAPDQIDARSHLGAHLLSAKPIFLWSLLASRRPHFVSVGLARLLKQAQ